jgi:hypothetical protein
MKIDFKGLLQGAFNSIFVKEEIEKIAGQRLAICRGCPFNSINAQKTGYETSRFDEHCTDCGCNLHMKTRCLSCKCPKDKWGIEMSEDEELKLNEKLK